MIPRIRLRLVLPLLLSGMAVLGCAAFVYIHYTRELDRVMKDTAAVLEVQAFALRNSLSDLLVRGERELAERRFTDAALDPRIRAMALVDAEGRVRFSTQRQWIGGPSAAVEGLDEAEASRLLSEHQDQLSASGAASLAGYFPMALDLVPGTLRDHRAGLLFVSFDLSDSFAQERHQLLVEAAWILGAWLFVALLLFVLVDALITRKVDHLVHTMGQVEKGSLTARSHFTGDDELSRLGRAFDRLLDQIAANQAELQDRELGFQRMVMAAPIPVGVCTAEGRIEFINPRFVGLFGYDQTDVPDLEHWWHLAYPDPEYRAEVQASWAEGVARARTEDGHLRLDRMYDITCKDGTRRTVEIQGTPVGDRVLVIFNDLTERVQAERRVRESENRFRSILENEPECVKVVSRDGLLLDMNAAGLAMIEAESLDQVRGRPLIDLVVPEYRERFQGISRRALQGEPALGEFEMMGLKGARRWMDTHAVPLRGADGQITSYLAVTRDITERKRADETLREASAYARNLIETSLDPLVTISPEGKITDVNTATEKITGVTRDRLIGQDFAAYFTDPDMARAGYQQVFSTGQVLDYPLAVRHVSGRVTEVLYNASVYRNKAGEVLGVFAAARDITERKRAEEMLRKAFAALEQSPVTVVITDTQGNIEYVNSACLRASGYAMDELRGQTPRIFKSGETSASEYRTLWETLKAGRVWEGRFHNRRKDGSLYWEQAKISPLRNDQGRITHFVAVKEDVTEILRREEERRQMEAQMAQSQKLESLGSLAGGVAHDMNNVLAAILSLASIQQMEAPEGTPLRKSLDTIEKACLRGRALVQGLLGFARKGLAEECLLNLNDLVRDQVALLERTTLQKVRLEMDLAEDIRPLKGDPSSLSHALMNLCVNAVDAMPEGGTLTLRTHNEGTASVCLEVGDTGVGMSPEVLEKALDPFFTTKPQGKGTGLGLSIVHGAVKAHKGSLILDSHPGAGTIARIILPASVPDGAQVPPAQAAPAEARVHSILVVDDDELLQQSTCQLLELLGHRPALATCGEEAVRMVEEGLPLDAVILDLNMPGMGGAAALVRIRELRPSLPVFLATGRADEEALDLVRRIPCVTLLAKPYALAKLKSLLRDLG
ncbi:MAG TPA: PAS domain S-box protein [Geothrix sp.]|nr:PAS domain S-box protein [Geothrix sp.]